MCLVYKRRLKRLEVIGFKVLRNKSRGLRSQFYFSAWYEVGKEYQAQDLEHRFHDFHRRKDAKDMLWELHLYGREAEYSVICRVLLSGNLVSGRQEEGTYGADSQCFEGDRLIVLEGAK